MSSSVFATSFRNPGNRFSFVIGVIARANERRAVEEFFQLFKTPWEHFQDGQIYDVLIVSGRAVPENQAKLIVCLSETGNVQTSVASGNIHIPVYRGSSAAATIRKEERTEQTFVYPGYNLWSEIEYLLSVGQPVEQAQVPTLELHIQLLRNLMLECGVDFVEIPPVPAGYAFAAALTHDIDFIGIRQHKFDHTLAGFLFRSTVGALFDCLRGRLSISRLARIWKALGSLPLVHLGLVKDFWLPFDWYLKVEQGIPATYYFIPFKHTPGDKVNADHAHRRGCAYDIGDIPAWIAALQRNGCEIGVHGIDAWHNAEKGRAELARVSTVSGSRARGVRMHWLLQNADTSRVLEEAGFEYDSTVGYNETIGYRAGTTQVYCPLSSQNLLELPMHIQDGALFFPKRLGLSDDEAWQMCKKVTSQAQTFGGVLTVIWHDRSHGPERFWGDFYVRFVQTLRSLNCWFGTAAEVVDWFRKRREVCFEPLEALGGTHTRLRYGGEEIQPPLRIRVYTPARCRNDGESAGATEFVDIPWNGKFVDELELQMTSRLSATSPQGALHS